MTNPYLRLLQTSEGDTAPAGARNPYSEMLDNMSRNEDQQRALTLNNALTVNPDEEAELRKLHERGKQAIVPSAAPDTAIGRLQAAFPVPPSPDLIPDKQQFKLDLSMRELMNNVADTPALKRKYTQEDFARIAHDDSWELSTVERTIKGLGARGFLTEFPRATMADLAFRKMNGEVLSVQEEVRLLEASEKVAELTAEQEGRGALSYALNIVGSTLGQLITGAPAGGAGAAAGAGTGIAIGFTTAIVGGQLGPQAAAPEEVITAPLFSLTGAAVGAQRGYAAGLAIHNFRQIAGLSYLEYSAYRDINGQLMEPEIARGAALVVAALGTGTETFADVTLSKSLPGFEKFLGKGGKEVAERLLATDEGRSALSKLGRRVAESSGVEAVTEGLQGVIEILGGEAAKAIAEEEFAPITLQEAGARVGESVLQGAIGGAGVPIVTAPVTVPVEQYFINRDAARQELEGRSAEGQLNRLDQAVQAAAQSKLLKRDRAVLEEFVNEAAEGTQLSDVFIAPDSFAQVAQDLGISVLDLAQQLGVEDQVQDSALTSTPIVVPVGKFISTVADTDLAQPLMEVAKLNPFLPSRAEIKAAQEAGDEQFIARAEALAAAVEQDETVRAEAEAISTRIAGELNTVGRFTGDANRVYATAATQMYVQLAQRLGITPQQAFDQYPLSVAGQRIGGQPEGQVLASEQADLPGSPQWEAAVAKGLDMSTEARMARAEEQGFTIEAFRGVRVAPGAGELTDAQMVGGGWFAATPETANTYAADVPLSRNKGLAMKARLKFDNPLVIDAGGRMFDRVPGAAIQGLEGIDPKRAYTTQEIARLAEQQGFDGVEFQNIKADRESSRAGTQPGTIWYVANPANIRSVNAAFDPDQAASADLLAQDGETLGQEAADLARAQALLASDPAALGLTPEQVESVNPIYRPAASVLPAKKLKNNKEAARLLERIFKAPFAAIKDFTARLSNAQIEHVATLMAAEAQLALLNTGNAATWYSTSLQRTMDVVGLSYPMLLDEQAAIDAGFGSVANARFVFTYILAVTSQNLTVNDNARATLAAFDQMLERIKVGDYTMSADWGTGDKQVAMGLNFEKFAGIVSAMPGTTFPERLARADALFREKRTVKEWVKALDKQGIPYNPPGQTNMDAVVYGSSLLGPKIGNGFWQNLNGNFSPLTIDLWMRRTWGRLTGKSIGNPEALPTQRARLKAAIERSRSRDYGNADVIAQVQISLDAARQKLARLKDLPIGKGQKKTRTTEIRTAQIDIDMLQEALIDFQTLRAPEGWKAEYNKDDEALLAYAQRLVRAWNKEYKTLREKVKEKHGPKAKVPDDLQPTWARAAKTVITNLGKPLDQVQNGTQRAEIEKAGARALELLADRGITITMADLQAALWYPEKELWGALTAELNLDEDGLPVVPPSALNESYDTAFARILGVKDGAGKELGLGSGRERAVTGQDARPEQPAGAEGLGRVGGGNLPGGPETETLGQEAVGRTPQPRVIYEVAPDPNNTELAARWRQLAPEQRLAVSKIVAAEILPGVLKDLDARGRVLDQVGSYLDDTNPSFALALAAGDVDTVAKIFGFVLSQDSMMAISPKEFPGSFQTSALRLDIGDKTFDEVAAIYSTLRAITLPDGRQPIGGQTTSDGEMTILLGAEDDADALSLLVDSALNGVYKVTTHDVYAAFPEKQEYDYASSESDPPGNAGLARQRARDARGEASRVLDRETDRILGERRSQATARPAGRDVQVDRGRLSGPRRLPDGTTEAVHYGRVAGITVTDPNEWGRGGAFLSRDERNRIGEAPPRTYFGLNVDLPGGYVKEAGTGDNTYYAYIPMDRMYDLAEDPDNLVERAKEIVQERKVAPRSALELAVQEAEYAGFWVDHPAYGMAGVVFEPVPVSTERRPDAVPDETLGQGEGLVSAAVRIGGKTYTGRNHDEAAQAARADGQVVDDINETAGFVDSRGKFLRRDDPEAVYAAIAAGQLDPARQRVIEIALRRGDTVTLTSDMLTFAEPGYQARGRRGEYSPRLKEIRLNASADFSTFLHELGHHFLEVYDSTALNLRDKEAAGETLTESEQGVIDDTWRLLTELARQTNIEVEGDVLDWWRGRSFEERVPMHEQFARLTEAYFMEGKAPTPALQTMFQTFRRWMLQVYKSLTELDVELNDEVRGILDRMVAAETDIKTAEENRGLNAMFATKPEFMTDDEWRGYQQLALAATQAAEDELTARSLRDMKWLSRAKAREIRKLQKQAAEQRAIVEAAVTAEVMSQPINRARTFLKRGLNPDGSEVQGPHKLSIEMLKAAYPEGSGVDWTALGYGRYGMLGKDGLDADMVAELFGFDSGDALVRALLEAEPAEATIEGETDRRMLEEFGDLVNEEAINRAADEALHNAMRGRVLAAEYAALAKASGQRKMLAAAAQQIAKQVIGKQNAAKLKPQKYVAAERSAARKAEQALRRNDLVGAATAKRDQLLNFELAREAQRVLKQRNRTLDLFRRVTAAKRDTVSKTRNYDLVQVARAILAAHGMGQVRNAPIEYMDLLKQYDPHLYTSLETTLLVAAAQNKTLADLSVDEFLGLGDLVKQLWDLSREEMQIEIDGRKVELEQITTELTERLAGLGDTERGQIAEAATDAQKNLRSAVGLMASLRRVEFWARSMDGGVVGPFTKYIWRPISEAADRYRADRNRLITKFRELFRDIEPTMGGKKIAAPELGYTFKNKAELLHAILHTGNTSNKRKLLLGRQWGSERPDGTLDESRWRQLISRMAQDGTLTKADFDFAQGVWDLLEETKPLAQATHRKVFGRYFAEITAEPVDTPFGTYKGGYVPAIYDQFFVADAAVRAQQEQVEANDSTMFPSPASGFTKGRVEYNEVLELNLQLLPMHIDRVLKFAHLASPVRDVLRVLRNKGLARGLEQVDPTAQSDMLLPWLQTASRQIVEDPSKSQGGKLATTFFRGLRNRTGLGLMFSNLVNVAQQFTGFPLVLLRVKPRHVGAALVRYTANPAGVTKAVRGASLMMAERGDNQMAAMYNAIEQIIDKKNLYKRTRDWLGRHTYFMQQAVQNVMDVVVWTAAYDQALAQGETEAEAAKQGDAVVRQTQGSVLPEDISRIEKGPAWARSFTHMYSYFSMWINLLGGDVEIIRREIGLRKGAGRLLYVYLIGFLAPAITAQLVADALRGQLPEDEDDDGYLDEWLSWFFMTQAKTALAFVPVAGQAGNAAIGAFTDVPYDDRVASSPSVSAFEAGVGTPASIYDVIVNDGDKSKAVKDTLNLMTLLTGIPFQAAARPIGYAVDVAEGDIEPTSDLDYLRGLATGTASEASR